MMNTRNCVNNRGVIVDTMNCMEGLRNTRSYSIMYCIVWLCLTAYKKSSAENLGMTRMEAGFISDIMLVTCCG